MQAWWWGWKGQAGSTLRHPAALPSPMPHLCGLGFFKYPLRVAFSLSVVLPVPQLSFTTDDTGLVIILCGKDSQILSLVDSTEPTSSSAALFPAALTMRV